jgi:hypothetical protein
MPNPSIPSGSRPYSPRRIFLPVLGLLAIVYLADYSWYQLRLHFPKLGLATGSVHRVRLLAVPIKNNRVDYEIDSAKPEEDVPCAHALFPRSGNRPCWYVTRHANDPIPM